MNKPREHVRRDSKVGISKYTKNFITIPPLRGREKCDILTKQKLFKGVIIPVVFQNLAFLAARKSPRIKDRKWVKISNMNSFAIFDPRGFYALECQLLNHDRYNLSF